MYVKKKLYYALALIFVSGFFIITVNVVYWGENKSDVEAKVAPQVFVQESTMPLVFTGRRELNGFKGYHNYRRGYRKYRDNWWYPEAAFVVLPHLNTKHTLLKGISDAKKLPQEHIESCRARYRSYNKNDNSYQPFYGPRKQCLSRFLKG
ncbi:BA14K family protein [Bartonella vinsonii]|uniref:Lectin-like protein BA14k n=1 Tax=Bartonella vinsonii TaxID=33047 RepID=A0A3S4Z343_BARVI|nr:BA14K family protein [Bartonella vinsonii]VEJ44576.1 Lectin-like protein BA14k precursor [Bartonella vinsonii]